MYKSDFKNGGFVEIEDDKDLACVVIGKEGSDVVVKGASDDVLRGIMSLTTKTMEMVNEAERFAFLMGLREKVVEKDLLPEDMGWKLFFKGEEIPAKFTDAAHVLLDLALRKIKKDR